MLVGMQENTKSVLPIIIPNPLNASLELSEIAELLAEFPGDTPVVGVVMGINENGEFAPEDETVEFEQRIAVSDQAQALIYERISDLLYRVLEYEMERVDASMLRIATTDSTGNPVWNNQIVRNGKVLAEAGGSFFFEIGWGTKLVEELEMIDDNPPSEEIPLDFIVSATNDGVKVGTEDFLDLVEGASRQMLDDTLSSLGLPTAQDASCWCASGKQRQDCHS